MLSKIFYKLTLAAAFSLAAVSANAISTSNDGEFFLVAYSATAKNTFVAAISGSLLNNATVNSFTSPNPGAANARSTSFASDANWLSFTGGDGIAAGDTKFSVIGINTTNKTLWTTGGSGAAFNVATVNDGNTTKLNSLVDSFTNGSGKLFTDGYTSVTALSGTTRTATVLSDDTSGISGNILSNSLFNEFSNTDITTQATVSPAASNNFYRLTIADANNPAASLTNTGRAGVFRFDDRGLLTYQATSNTIVAIAAVPEADTSAMLLIGAGVMGFIARRKRAIKSNQE